MKAADRVAVYGGRADTTDLWASVLGDSQAAATVAGHGRALRTMPVAELAKLPHVGISRAARIFSVVELGRRLLSLPLVRGHALKSPKDVFDIYGRRLLDLERESFWAVYLDVKGRVVSDELISIGTQTVCPVAPADVLRTAIRVGAVGIIVLHTHPSSGDPTPSDADDDLTAQLAHVSRLLGIELVDHVVIGDRDHYSYAVHDRLPRHQAGRRRENGNRSRSAADR